MDDRISEIIWAPAHLTISGDVILYDSINKNNSDTEDYIIISRPVFE